MSDTDMEEQKEQKRHEEKKRNGMAYAIRLAQPLVNLASYSAIWIHLVTVMHVTFV